MKKILFFLFFIFISFFAVCSPITNVFADIPDNQTLQNQFPDYYNYAASAFGFPVGGAGGGLPAQCSNPVQGSNGSDPTADDYRVAIKKNFGLELLEYPNVLTLDQLQQTYDTACILYSSSTFRDLIKTLDNNGKPLNPITVNILLPSTIIKNGKKIVVNGCGSGHARPILTVGWCSRTEFGSKSVYMNRFVLTHELGHNLEYRNDPIRKAFESSGLFSAANPGQDLPTYNCQHDYDSATQHGPYEDECFADMVGEFPVYNNFFHFDTSKTFSDFTSTYKNWYNFASTYIFGGTNFQLANLPLPNPIPFPISSAQKDAQMNEMFGKLTSYPTLTSIYKQASTATGIPWTVFAAIHFREGGMNLNQSLVSGRFIGSDEPDVDKAGGCSPNNKLGAPKPIGNRKCGFTSLLDTAVYAGNLLKIKNNNAVPKNFQELVRALSGYNGYGNQDCGNGQSVYKGCPAVYPSEDSPYALNFFDQKHSVMQQMYCYDGVLCPNGTQDENIGTATSFVELYRKGYR